MSLAHTYHGAFKEVMKKEKYWVVINCHICYASESVLQAREKVYQCRNLSSEVFSTSDFSSNDADQCCMVLILVLILYLRFSIAKVIYELYHCLCPLDGSADCSLSFALQKFGRTWTWRISTYRLKGLYWVAWLGDGRLRYRLMLNELLEVWVSVFVCFCFCA